MMNGVTDQVATLDVADRQPGWLSASGATHVGRREVNEDAFLIDGALLAVADGVGGAPRGDLAASAAVAALEELAAGSPPRRTALADALRIADEQVVALGDRWRELRGAATTMTAAIVFEDVDRRAWAQLAHAGDSRAYLWRAGTVTQLTSDHTLGQAAREAGLAPAMRADNTLVNMLGGPNGTGVDVDELFVQLLVGDVLLLCSDGVSSFLEPAEIAGIIEQFRGSPDAAAATLVRRAYDRGSNDNLTAVVGAVDVAEAPAL